MTEVGIRLGPRSYTVSVGAGGRNGVAGQLRSLLGSRFRRHVHVIADRRVARLHPVPAGWSAHPIMQVPAGERSKRLATVERLGRELVQRGAGRDAVILAYGGGVVGDLSGFVASVLTRGVRLVMVPTTLLAMVDSSVGGKTGVNLPEGKNLLGTFHQPAWVTVDPEFLGTLPARELRAGWAELLKAGILRGGRFWTDLLSAEPRIGTADPGEALLGAAIRYKARIVAADEEEAGQRRVLNLGHTLAHALEAATGYRHYRHGEAVALGLMFVASLSQRLEGLSEGESEEITRLASTLPPRPPSGGIDWEDLEPFLARDKKVRSGRLAWVLLTGLGHPKVVSGVPRGALRSAHRSLRRGGWL